MNKTDRNLPIGDIIKKLKVDYFDYSVPTNEFQKNCLHREYALKEYLNVTMEMLVEYLKPENIENKSKRHQIKSQQSYYNLAKYVEEIYNELDKDLIEAHCRKMNNSPLNFDLETRMAFNPDILFLIQNSFHTVVASNIMWSDDITLIEGFEISKGKMDLNKLGKYIPRKIEYIKERTLPFLKNSEHFSTHIEPINEALLAFKKKLYRSCNLLLMTTVEGVVRNLATFLSEYQNLGEGFSEEKYHSLNSLLRDVKWKKDYKIDSTKLRLILGENKTLSEKRKEGIKGKKEDVLVSLDVALDFLKDRFKDNRDMIMHGTFQDYNTKWNLYLNFAALVEVDKVCRNYINLYEKNS